MKPVKTILSLSLILFLLTSLFVGTRAETRLTRLMELSGGDVVLVLEGIAPTNQPKQDVYLKTKEAALNGLDWGTYHGEVPSDGVWHLEILSATTCTLQAKSRGKQGYVNLRAGSLTFGEKSTLNYTFNGSLKLFIREGNETYYLRFTNLNDTPRLHAGKEESSFEWIVYRDLPVKAMKTSDAANEPMPAAAPLYTIACLADCHSDYGLQEAAPYVRQSVITVSNAIRRTEDANIVLFGGDMISDNARRASSGGWTPSIYQNVLNAYDTYASGMTYNHYSLYCAGNHEYQAGNSDHYDSYQGFVDLMEKRCGKPLSVLRQKDDSSLPADGYPDYVLGLRYQLDGFDYLIINAPRGKSDQYSEGAFSWLAKQLKEIGSTKTVFLIGHFPIHSDKGAGKYGLQNQQAASLMNILGKYPNVIYLNGHVHGESNDCFIQSDTFERISHYNYEGSVVTDRKAVPIGFLSCFMGSEAYYNYPWQPYTLGTENPAVVQTLLIYIYRDRIVFQMKNYGTSYAIGNYTVAKELKPWTLMRDMSAYFEEEPTKPSENTSTSETATGTDTPSTDSVTNSSDPTATEKPTISSASIGTETKQKGPGAILWVAVSAGIVFLALIAVLLLLFLRKKTLKKTD